MKLYFDEKYFVNPASELVILSPFLDAFKPDERFEGSINDKSNELTSIEDCDYVVMPYKWNQYNHNNYSIISEAKKHGKKVLIFHIDDSTEDIDVENAFVFRTSFYKSTQKSYERSMPCFKIDTFEGNYLDRPRLSIGFCGQVLTPIRRYLINILENQKGLDCDFIIRDVHWPMIEEGKTQQMVESEFYENMTNNLFNLCIRGGGNFSYRVYETLMMGRIPIIIDTDIVLPFDDVIDWNEHAVIIKNGDDIVKKITDFYNENDVEVIQFSNREFWEEYLSPKGFIKNLYRMINV